MDYGTYNHVPSPEDRTILTCKECDWEGEFVTSQLHARAPWYCIACGKRVYHYITFGPDERYLAYQIQERSRNERRSEGKA